MGILGISLVIGAVIVAAMIFIPEQFNSTVGDLKESFDEFQDSQIPDENKTLEAEDLNVSDIEELDETEWQLLGGITREVDCQGHGECNTQYSCQDNCFCVDGSCVKQIGGN